VPNAKEGWSGARVDLENPTPGVVQGNFISQVNGVWTIPSIVHTQGFADRDKEHASFLTWSSWVGLGGDGVFANAGVNVFVNPDSVVMQPFFQVTSAPPGPTFLQNLTGQGLSQWTSEMGAPYGTPYGAGFEVQEGDTIQASIAFDLVSGQTTFNMTNRTPSLVATYQQPLDLSGATIAAWVVNASSGSGHMFPTESQAPALARYGKLFFDNAWCRVSRKSDGSSVGTARAGEHGLVTTTFANYVDNSLGPTFPVLSTAQHRGSGIVECSWSVNVLNEVALLEKDGISYGVTEST
jgi:hypothetical protein